VTDSLIVSVDIEARSVDVGTAFFSRRRNALTTSFRYDEGYLRRKEAFAIDPALALFSGSHQTDGLPGAFADCSPDRWGKNLIGKKLQAQALRDGRTPPSFSDVDFLIGVSDLTRQGALRFRETADGPYLDPDLTVPKMVELPRLLRAADQVADDGDDLTAIKTLLDAGSGSLGGARPKASARDGGRLLIAKLPHHSDQWDVMAWEKTALDLAERAGIDVPGYELVRIAGRSVLVLDRFDRNAGRRIPYISAMTLLSGRDGDAHDYTEVAETLTEYSSRTAADLRQLWRRIAFSIAIHNTDDHLRNHGFLRTDATGWHLSPAFDINPNPNVVEERVTGIGGARGRADELTGLMMYAATFDLTESDARRVLLDVIDATANWRRVASANGIHETEQKRFESAFDGLRTAMLGVSGGGGAATAQLDARTGRQLREPKGARNGGRFAAKSEDGKESPHR
jgi:serine/threonine-protein kinase HipA